jgi:uncharacterized protein
MPSRPAHQRLSLFIGQLDRDRWPTRTSHHRLQPGEALLPNALVGMVVLLPLSWAPRWANLANGLAATVVPVALFGGTILLVPGLLVTGFALAQFGLPDALDRLRPHLLAVFLLADAGSVPALLWQEQDPMGAGHRRTAA